LGCVKAVCKMLMNLTPDVGNFCRQRATFGLNLCLASQIYVKNANSKIQS
jgi:hypothetical protein